MAVTNPMIKSKPVDVLPGSQPDAAYSEYEGSG
jgi:hypothetical protein